MTRESVKPRNGLDNEVSDEEMRYAIERDPEWAVDEIRRLSGFIERCAQLAKRCAQLEASFEAIKARHTHWYMNESGFAAATDALNEIDEIARKAAQR